jgi:TIR domain
VRDQSLAQIQTCPEIHESVDHMTMLRDCEVFAPSRQARRWVTAVWPGGTLSSVVKHGPENAITRVASALKECLSDTNVLRQIDDFFNDLGFEFDPEAEEWELQRGIGQRRSRAEGYLATLDLDDPSDRDRLFAAVGAKLTEWGDGRGPSPDRLTRLQRTLRGVGYEWNGTEVVPRAAQAAGRDAKPARPPARPTPPAEQTRPRPLTTAHDESIFISHTADEIETAEALAEVLNAPSLFISYAHEDSELVHRLAKMLRERGCRVWIDVEEIRIGDDMVSRIPEAIASVDFLLAIISEDSVRSAWCERELSIAVTAALETHRVMVLPIRLGSVLLPASLKGIYSPRVDPSNVEAMANRIMADMERHRTRGSGGTPAPARPVPPPSDPTPTLPSAPNDPPRVDPEESIRIIGVDEDGVTQPRNDGTAGSGLYKVPLRLNRKPSITWMRLLPAVWDHPPEFTTMHRPGIASVSGDRIILDGTTMEEVERYHAATLRKVIPEVNRKVAEQEAAEREKRNQADDDRRAHDESVREAAKRIKFD